MTHATQPAQTQQGLLALPDPSYLFILMLFCSQFKNLSWSSECWKTWIQRHQRGFLAALLGCASALASARISWWTQANWVWLDISTMHSITQALGHPSFSFILSSPDNEELLVQFLQNHIWDKLQIDVPMPVIHHVKNTNTNLKSNCSHNRLRLAASHQREPFVEGLCLERAPTLDFWQQERLLGPQSHLKADWKKKKPTPKQQDHGGFLHSQTLSPI